MRGHAKRSYEAGEWFAVPLRQGGYALGIVARLNGKGIVLGYFFGPRRAEVPALDAVTGLRHERAALVSMFGDPGLRSGRWPRIGRDARWRPEDWPTPLFARIDVSAQRAWVSRYSEETLRCIEERPVDVEVATAFPADVLSGYGALETRLSKLCP